MRECLREGKDDFTQKILSRGSEVLCECWRALARGERDMIAAVNTENYLKASK